MHIPDGYLAPQTAIPLLVAAVPLLAVGVKKVGETVKKREVPVLAVGAAFSFVIMMFNLPIPGGSSAHAVGAVLLAILMGPWAAFVGVSVALIIQALVFGDGGVMAIGANCINIALVMSFVGYYVYRMIRGNADSTSGRAVVAAFLAGYVALNAAAFITALEFGSQYHLFQAADGTPLYFMYPLKVAIAAMMSEHLLLAGPVEGIVTSLGMLFVSRNYPEMLSRNMIAGSKNWGVDSHV
ncbi:cobalt transporter CbiM [Syntrophomonas wolfei]|uniref:cobalt transporter CbiM n=1 Tax=Syntrophomonas wolfei TaxID=863 RepID=UPI0023EFD8C6|nr:cobalt transporter CbiM [Syntrophomonas wolfei]